MTQIFFSKDECLQALRDSLGEGEVANEVAQALLLDMRATTEDGGADAMQVKVGTWAIRDDELDLLALIKDSALAYLNGKTAGASPWVSLAITVAKMLLTLWRKGVRLTNEQTTLLTELRRQPGPRAEAEIAEELKWTPEAVAGRLAELAAAPARSGAVKLAERRPDGRWVAYA
jgi:hypothetical protein